MAPPEGAPKAADKPKPGKELNLFAWSEYIPQEVIDGFSKETGIKAVLFLVILSCVLYAYKRRVWSDLH